MVRFLFCPFCGFSNKNFETECQTKQSFHNSTNTNGGSYVSGSVDVEGDFIGRDKINFKIFQTISEVDAIDQNERKKLLLNYKELIKDIPENSKLHLTLALLNLDLKLYEEAENSLLRAHSLNPLSSRILYYRCIVGCHGKRPSSLSIRHIKYIEKFVKAAISLNDKYAEYAFLWALIKEDFYEFFELRIDYPSTDILVKKALKLNLQPKELQHLLRHVPVTEGFVLDTIQNVIAPYI
jgi:hypothetical protein